MRGEGVLGGRGGGTFGPISICHGCAARFDCRVQCPYSDVVRAVEDVKSRVPVVLVNCGAADAGVAVCTVEEELWRPG